MSDSPGHLGWLALGSVPGLGSRKAGKLLNSFGTPDAIFAASLTELEAHGLPAVVVQAIQSQQALPRAEKELARVKELDRRLIAGNDPEYPRLLREIYDPPALIYLLRPPGCLAVIGLPSLARDARALPGIKCQRGWVGTWPARACSW